MTKQKRTMQELSYGIEHPRDLLAKLEWDADKLSASPHPYDVFNFILTAAALAEWIQKFYSSKSAPKPFSAPTKERKTWLLPDCSSQWIGDTSCLPNRHRQCVRNVDRSSISAIGENPPIRNYYQWFNTSTAPDLYLDYQGENYGLQQIKGILLQFYKGLIEYLDEIRSQEQRETRS